MGVSPWLQAIRADVAATYNVSRFALNLRSSSDHLVNRSVFSFFRRLLVPIAYIHLHAQSRFFEVDSRDGTLQVRFHSDWGVMSTIHRVQVAARGSRGIG